jgi:hypothetical protein
VYVAARRLNLSDLRLSSRVAKYEPWEVLASSPSPPTIVSIFSMVDTERSLKTHYRPVDKLQGWHGSLEISLFRFKHHRGATRGSFPRWPASAFQDGRLVARANRLSRVNRSRLLMACLNCRDNPWPRPSELTVIPRRARIILSKDQGTYHSGLFSRCIGARCLELLLPLKSKRQSTRYLPS